MLFRSKGTAQSLFSYANNFNLRHCNVDMSLTKNYQETIADLNDKELVKWYDYIYAFALNIYQNLDKVKDVNISGSFKRQDTKLY